MATDRPSLFGALAGGDQPVGSQILAKRTLLAISRAIEDEAMSRAASPLVFGAFQRERNYRAVEHRYRAMARTADAVVVFADFERLGTGGAIAEVPLEAGGALGNEWAVVIDAPGYSACLLAWEQPRSAQHRARPRAAPSRRSGRSTRARCGGRRRSAPRWRAAPTTRWASASSSCCPSARWRWSIPRRA